ncbi:MAG: PIN domain-containing protein [Chloroflexota bacterium]|nr:PIN domain-containing protein [Chloroflexota bacterium]
MAALISLKHKLPMADSLIYATARNKGALVWTQDEYFRSPSGMKYKEAREKDWD